MAAAPKKKSPSKPLAKKQMKKTKGGFVSPGATRGCQNNLLGGPDTLTAKADPIPHL